VRYGNGGVISEVDLVNIREACEANTRELLMEPGDAVYLDNFATLHGRKPFVGTRRHTVVWFLD
jgi:alpha-ketoglutarate-dependent taurine dioxygenase